MEDPAVGTAGQILRRARRMQLLTQRELARRMGVQQSVVSTYERGIRVPTIDTLERMLDAAGMRLTWQLTHGGSGGGTLARLTGPIGRRLVERRLEVVAALAARGLTRPLVVADVAEGTEGPFSQLVLVVEHADDAPPDPLLKFAAAGAVGAIVARRALVLLADELEAHGYHPNDLDSAVDLDPPPSGGAE